MTFFEPFDPRNVKGHYILNAEGQPVEERNLIKWATWFEDGKFPHIAHTLINDQVFVSTVFLGFDHRFFGKGPAILWETMVFKNGEVLDQCRYASIELALAGHEILVEKWKHETTSETITGE